MAAADGIYRFPPKRNHNSLGLINLKPRLQPALNADLPRRSAFDGEHRGEALIRVHVLEQVEHTALAARVAHLRIHEPGIQGLPRHALRQHTLTESVLGDGRLEPVGALREALEGRRGRVHAVLARERLVGQPERLPLREDLPAKRRERRL